MSTQTTQLNYLITNHLRHMCHEMMELGEKVKTPKKSIVQDKEKEDLFVLLKKLKNRFFSETALPFCATFIN